MPDILNVVDIKAPVAEVHALVATGDGIARWWSTTVESSGDEVTVRFGTDWQLLLRKEAETKTSVRWRIVEHDSPEWVGTQLVFQLSHEEGWTTLEFDHAGWTEATSFFRFCSTKWSTFLLSIKQAAETGTGKPWPNEVKIGRHD